MVKNIQGYNKTKRVCLTARFAPVQTHCHTCARRVITTCITIVP